MDLLKKGNWNPFTMDTDNFESDLLGDGLKHLKEEDRKKPAYKVGYPKSQLKEGEKKPFVPPPASKMPTVGNPLIRQP